MVTVRREADGVDVELRNTEGRGLSTPSYSGRGLVGMRERVEVFGGALDAGPTAEGGFRVHARLPLPTD